MPETELITQNSNLKTDNSIELVEGRLFRFEVIKHKQVLSTWPLLKVGDIKQGIYRTDYHQDYYSDDYIPVFKNGCNYVLASGVRVLEDITDRN